MRVTRLIGDLGAAGHDPRCRSPRDSLVWRSPWGSRGRRGRKRTPGKGSRVIRVLWKKPLCPGQTGAVFSMGMWWTGGELRERQRGPSAARPGFQNLQVPPALAQWPRLGSVRPPVAGRKGCVAGSRLASGGSAYLRERGCCGSGAGALGNGCPRLVMQHPTALLTVCMQYSLAAR